MCAVKQQGYDPKWPSKANNVLRYIHNLLMYQYMPLLPYQTQLLLFFCIIFIQSLYLPF